jgi:predicted dehydrogenase
MLRPVQIAVVGCGAISGAYINNCRQFPLLEIVACSDINREAAEAKAKEFGIGTVMDFNEVLADQSIELVLNLTVPKAHAPVTLAAIKAGKHVYTEKPLGITRGQAMAISRFSTKYRKLVGGAPDTFLGAGLQTARKAIDDGLIGRPVGFTAYTMGPGHEHWHPLPNFFYEPGGGPMLDMGPYYVTALLNLLGPAKHLSGMASIAIPRRTITSQPNAGKIIQVATPDHVCGIMEFEQGAIGTIIASFATKFPQYDGRWPIVIYGTEGTLLVPDPNRFDGSVRIRRTGDSDFADIPPVFSHQYERGIGLLDMAYAIRRRRPMRAGLEQIWCVLDIMLGFLISARTGRRYFPRVKYHRPKPMPADLEFGVLE